MSDAPENIVSVIASHAAEGLLLRLQWMTLEPASMLVMGREVEGLSKELQARYPEAVMGQSERYDLIIANLELPWQDNLLAVVKAWQAFLQPGGLLMVTTLGLDTFKELPDQTAFMATKRDMHEIGDALVQAGLSDPVMEVEHYNITYKDATRMIAELSHEQLLARPLLSLPEQTEGKWHLTCEIVYGHAWFAESTSEEGVTKVPLSLLREQLRRRD